MFLRVTAHLYAVGIITLLDQDLVARYAILSVHFRECVAFIAKHGTTYAQRKPVYGQPEHPGVVVGFKLYPQMRLQLELASELLKAERDLGLSPASRTRLTVGSQADLNSDKSKAFAEGDKSRFFAGG